MAFLSKEAGDAARAPSGTRGVGASFRGSGLLRELGLLFRGGRSGAARHQATAAARDDPLGTQPAPIVASETPAPTGLNVAEAGRDGLRRLVLTGELDAQSVPTLEDAISRCCGRETRAVTLDLSRLGFIDSSGLWTITSAKRWCERQGYGFSLIRGPESIQEVFELTGLSDLLPFRDDDGAPSPPQRNPTSP